MKKTALILIITVLILAGSVFFVLVNQKSRNEMYQRMTEMAAETLAALPTDTPVPTATPTGTPEPTAVPTDIPTPTQVPTRDPNDWQNWPELPESVSPELKQLYFIVCQLLVMKWS